MTSIAASKAFSEDRLWLNGKEIEINGRGRTCLALIRSLAQNRVDEHTGEIIVKKDEWSSYHVHICSINTFPTGAGLASSAAGLACFVATLGNFSHIFVIICLYLSTSMYTYKFNLSYVHIHVYINIHIYNQYIHVYIYIHI